MDWKQEARDLVKGLNESMGPSPYDTAWLARLRNSDASSLRENSLDWLMENQYSDGSWGSAIHYHHDRIICTLTAAIALSENGQSRAVRDAIRRAERYIWHNLHLLSHDPFELVGFELILPTLLGEAQALGVEVPSHAYGYEKIQTAKLRLVPVEKLYSSSVTTVHSLEFLGQAGDPVRLREMLSSNGSLGNSPATTAYYLLLDPGSERALAYLQAVQRHQGYPVMLYPFRIFELSWVLNNLAFCKLPITELAGGEVFETLQVEMGENGIGLDPSFGIPDGDTTSVCVRLLRSAGYEVDPFILAGFENKEASTFRTYDYERNASVGTNAHALEALSFIPEYPNRRSVQEQITLLLLDKRIFNTYWIDKWHASPFYATSHVLVALLQAETTPYLASACRSTVDWLVHLQYDDGSWGFFGQGTAEETAYAMIALLHYSFHHSIDVEVLHRGAAFLQRTYNTFYPALWIDKCLYVPVDIVRAAILSALILYTEAVGCL